MNELKLLKGDPIEVCQGLFVYPLKLSEIAEIGEEVYNSFVKVFLINKSLMNEPNFIPLTSYEKKEIYKYNDLDFILYLCKKDINLSYLLINGLSLFLQSEVSSASDTGVVIKNDNVKLTLTNELYIEIKKVICKQNFIHNAEDTSFNPANEKAKALLEKMKKAKEKIQKQNKDEGLSLKTIISLVATYSNDINIFSIWNLTVNQLYESYLRIALWDDYHNKHILIPHASDIESLDMKHWAIDINKLNK
jgi:hypothetical protein